MDTKPSIPFEEIDAPKPDLDQVRAEYAGLRKACEAATDTDALMTAVGRWDQLRRRISTWSSLTGLRFSQDTRNPDYRKAREELDEMRPQLTELSVSMMRALLDHPERPRLEQKLGHQAFALWESEVTSFDPAIKDDLVEEARLEARYTELTASATLEFRGETFNLPEILKFREDPDRATRHDAEAVRWDWFSENSEELDQVYDKLVRVRDRMARTLGYDDFVGLGYKRMSRVDYGQEEVRQYRAAVQEHVVPLAETLRDRQAEKLGVEPLMFWDSSVHDPRGNPRPQGDHDWMLERAQEMFDAVGGGMDDFFRRMREGHYLDLKARPGKAGGGFCTSFYTVGMPFIFANFNGTKGDVEVFTHEMGHAFQYYMSRNLPLADYLWPSMESCEIHSMGLEFLTWPHMERFFGPDAERFCRTHLVQSLLFLPYGVAVDHFQHKVYENPAAGPQERLEMWREMEATYLPWTRYGDLDRLDQGGLWQAQSHIYVTPFYYIDYTLAQVCALQFWVRSRRDPAEAIEAYVALCRRGGEAPFQELVRSAGLVSPFEAGCLAEVLREARTELQAA